MLRAQLIDFGSKATDDPGDTGDQVGMAHPVVDIEDLADTGHHVDTADYPDTGVLADTEVFADTEVLADAGVLAGTGNRLDIADQDQDQLGAQEDIDRADMVLPRLEPPQC